jgi:hypothetical protein
MWKTRKFTKNPEASPSTPNFMHSRMFRLLCELALSSVLLFIGYLAAVD